MITPTLAMEYDVEDSAAGVFGPPTSVEPVTVVGATSESDNINRSKDSAVIPPPFGSEMANIPGTGAPLTPSLTGGSPGSYSGAIVYPDITPLYPDSGNAGTITEDLKFTLPDGLYYADGSLGTLKIPTLDLKVKVYETESLESLAKGAGHFKSTSCWDGNVGLAGHNRGVNNNFGQIHTLDIGDKITYTTLLGTMTYEVTYVGKISETDYSYLQRSSENMITLVTCVRNVPDQRWCVQACEVN